jgi:hypothetical protein
MTEKKRKQRAKKENQEQENSRLRTKLQSLMLMLMLMLMQCNKPQKAALDKMTWGSKHTDRINPSRAHQANL